MLASLALASALMLSHASRADAQTVVDPHYVQFTPSPDHHAVSNGVAVVSRYDLEFFLLGGLIPLEVLDIGKPMPAADGNIYVNFLPSSPVPGVTYEARVSAVGPGGAVDSSASNLFTFTGSCNFVLSTTLLSSAANGGSASLNVLTNSGCTWTPTTSASWITILTNSTSGPGNVNLSVAANNTASTRVGYVSVAGQMVTMTQAAAAGSSSGGCASALTTSVSAAAAGLTGTIGVSAGEACGWQASSPASWATVSPASGAGAGTVTYNIAANSSTSTRTTTLLVGGSSVTVTQAAAAPVACGVAATTSLSIPASGGSGAVALSAGEACSWQASSPVSWATVAPASGKGAGNVSYSVAANTSTTPRTTTIVIGTTSVALSQAAAPPPCSPAVSTASASLPADGGSGSVGVTAQAGCGWTASTSSSWVTLSPLSGTANGSVTYKAAANTSSTSRVATLAIGGQVVMLTQSGLTTPVQCVRTVATSSISAPAAGSSGSLSITATGCDTGWQTSSPVSWVTLSPTSGSTSTATVTYKIAANTSTAPRTTTLAVNGQSVAVSQAGTSSCSYSLSASSASFQVAGGDSYFKVSTGTGCSWQAKSNAFWITITEADGIGAGPVAYRVRRNYSKRARTGTITVAGKTFTISQSR